MVSSEDVFDIWQWNSEVPDTVEDCVHHLITRTCQKYPQAQAICAWDGDWTYAEIDYLSSQLARHLVSYGVGPEVVVPLCMEKNRDSSERACHLVIIRQPTACKPTNKPASKVHQSHHNQRRDAGDVESYARQSTS